MKQCPAFLLLFSCLIATQLLFGQTLDAGRDSLVTDELVIRPIAEGVYVHTCFLQTNDFGKVPCNGMIVVSGGEAIIFDTPTTDSSSAELIRWIEDRLHCRVTGVIATHFHDDCLGGLNEFHRRGIPSYANRLTQRFAQENHAPVPQHGFDDQLQLAVGSQPVIADFVGEGHTRDNVIGYFPAAHVLFGGCLVKELGAGEGYLGDASVGAWSSTVSRARAAYPEATQVIPGHGIPGDVSLLDYTIKLFAPYR
ncbi:subclass B1 metallo-beta-lactamase [Parapedobacter lycopersici]|uniref:subclass B1 metallo-beta-lactamase n=1 Tax=Parapedobacter lycopersici TaxID=1864939 RepID=UPI00214D3B2A|nr:subclass B1 metallo-beta-lactamase [Parapedobacter lycopersici]